MRIGVTERGDPSIDKSWPERVKSTDGAIIITKRVTIWLATELLRLHNEGFPIVLHATCTGHGGTWIEPYVSNYQTQIDSICHLLAANFPKENIVLRIDPIIPDQNGLTRLNQVLSYADAQGLLPNIRTRISILDEYRHVKARFKAAGHNEVFPGRFTANAAERQRVTNILMPYHDKYGMTFECCAETELDAPCYEHIGCVSTKDLTIMGLTPDTDLTNPQNRRGCMCLTCKYELLNKRQQCPNKCAYCYWR